MDPMEVIDLSSDDENIPPKNQDTGSSVTADKDRLKNEDIIINNEDVEVVCEMTTNSKRSIIKANAAYPKTKKRKLSEENDNLGVMTNLFNKTVEIPLHRLKRIKPDIISKQCTYQFLKSEPETENNRTSRSSLKTYGKTGDMVQNNSLVKHKPKSLSGQKNTHSFKINEGASSSKQFTNPQLTLKNKVKISETVDTNSEPSIEAIESFFDACRSRDSSKDMEKIIGKLRKRYNKLEPSYAKSSSFINLIHKKMNIISNDRKYLFCHIAEIMDEMRVRQIKNRSLIENENNRDIAKTGTSTPSELGDIPENDTMADEYQMCKYNERVRILEIAMRRCEQRIKKCEEAEVNFDDENDSHYLMAAKYKSRMIELYNKYCEITNEKPDAARPYLRPKNCFVTDLLPLNRAITSFINMKITKMNKSLLNRKKNGGQIRPIDGLIFPDFVDVLNCIKKCNEEQNLNLTKAEQESKAAHAFHQLAEYLQRCRQQDYYDTFSLYLEQADNDPALEDSSLAEKLSKNQETGQKNLDRIFQEFVEKQSAAKATGDESGLAKEKDDKETDNKSSKNADHENSIASLNEEIGVGAVSASHESETNDGEEEIQVNTKKADIKDIVPLKPQDHSNQKRNKNTKLIDSLDKSSQTPNNKIEVDQPPNNLNLKANDTLKLDKLQNDLKQNDQIVWRSSNNVEVHTQVDRGEKTIGNEKLCNDPSSICDVNKISEKSVTMNTNKSVKVKILDDMKITEPKVIEIVEKQVKLLQTKQNMNKVADSQNSPKTTLLPSQTEELASTVAKCDLNLVQTTKTTDANSIDACSPTIPANNTKAIDAAAVTQTMKPIGVKEEKKPILRIRPFAKPPGSWKDVPTNSIIEKHQTDSETRKIRTFTKPIAIEKTVQVKSDIIGNIKNQKYTVMLPTKLNKTRPHFSVNAVTNNVTFNFNNQEQFRQQTTSAPLVNNHRLKPAHKVVSVNYSEEITTNYGDVGIININPKKETTPKTSNRARVRIVSRQDTIGITSEEDSQISPAKSGANQGRKIFHHIPLIDKSAGGKTIVQLISPSVDGKAQNIIVPAGATVLTMTSPKTYNPSQKSDSNSSTVRDSHLKLNVAKHVRPIITPKIIFQSSNKVAEGYEATTDGIPTVVID